ncbi:hypothetical protein [Rhizobium paknamense]|uniref:Uncharacterized protein n=1 Tax=Rhizobium paknamense TaxID=1206817 RepID=A0ABU0IFJ1_9HYPH|nr:hypothetical protein [Rhizobium paknamense]MDQ0456021.1 hypothetical protein [Rhizobium paknamense]
MSNAKPRRKPKTSTLPNRATAETIPRFQMRTKDGVWITVARITAHVEMVEQQQKRRSVINFKNWQSQNGERKNAEG